VDIGTVLKFFQDRLDGGFLDWIKKISLGRGMAGDSTGTNGNQGFSKRANLF